MKHGHMLFKAMMVTGIGALSMVAGMGFSGALNLGPNPGVSPNTFFDPIIDVHSTLAQRYVSEIDEKTLQQAAINGMLEALNDPYTMYVPPVDKNEFSKELLGEYVGIGAQIVVQDQWLTIVSPLEDSPAIRAGILPGDRVKEIDGKSTFGKTDVECVQMLTGEPGTPVKLTIERAGETLTMDIVRNQIKTRSVKGVHREDADATRWHYLIDPSRKIAYIRLTQFTPKCSDEVDEALKSIGADKGQINGLILDLRGNPGGVLSEAEKIADFFLKSGVIVSTKGRTVAERITRAEEPGTYPEFPIAVLINGASASASEVLAGALVENDRAITIGTRTYGKGSVQAVETLKYGQGAQLKFTEQGYYLPSGRSITRKDDSATWGVDPTDGFFLSIADKEVGDILRVRRDEEVIRTGHAADAEKKWSDPEWIITYLKDRQLAAALKAVQVKADTGEWKPTGESGKTEANVAIGELQRMEITRERITRELTRLDNRMAALANSAEGITRSHSNDLIPDDAALNGGKLEVYDKDGKLITTLRMTDDYLERWLMDAGVEKLEDSTTDQPTAPSTVSPSSPVPNPAPTTPTKPIDPVK